MVAEFIISLFKELHNKGISWGFLLTALLLWTKLQRNKEFKERDERVERNQRKIMAHWGIEGEWVTPRKTLTQTALLSLRKLYFLLQVEISQVFQFGEVRKMNKPWLAVLVGYILAQIALKTGLVIPPEATDWVVDGITLIVPIVLAFMNKTKAKPQQVDPPDVPPDTRYQDPQAANHSH